jgi:glycosyltransferase involved in cell wall biosynthesis
LNILLVSRRYWPATGGVETFLRHIARELGKRHAVTVLTGRVDDGPNDRLTDSLRPPPTFEPFLDGDARVVPLRLSPRRRAALAPLVSQVVPGLRRYAWGRVRVPMAALYARVAAPEIGVYARGVDVLHMWGGDLVACAAMHSARELDVPRVLTPFAHPDQYGTGPVDLSAYRAADKVVALLEADARLYASLGVPRSSIEVCGVCSPGVDAGHGERIRSQFEIDGPLVVFLGVRRAYKGFDLLLQAAPLVDTDIPGTTFAFVGPGQRLPNTGSPRVVDAGVVDEDDRAGWLEAADVVCLPSDAEIFPLAVLEAWSVGTPVVTSDLPPLVELLGKAGGGLTARREPRVLADALISMLTDSEQARSMGRAGHAFWRDGFTVSSIAGRYEEMYEALRSGEERGGRCAA